MAVERVEAERVAAVLVVDGEAGMVVEARVVVEAEAKVVASVRVAAKGVEEKVGATAVESADGAVALAASAAKGAEEMAEATVDGGVSEGSEEATAVVAKAEARVATAGEGAAVVV